MQFKHKCRDCKQIVEPEEWLVAPHPFIQGDAVTGCPKCMGIDTLVHVCDEDGCVRDATCGTPTEHGYRNTCYDHKPKDSVRGEDVPVVLPNLFSYWTGIGSPT